MRRCSTWVAGVRTYLAECAYEPLAHRWWRLRESQGTTWWEVSPDGERWTVLFSKANPVNLTACTIEFGAGTYQPVANPGVAIFDRGNPYDPPGTAKDARKQVGFTTFGPVHLLQLLIEVAGRAGRAVWWQKWGVHRRLRPEEYGGRIDNQLNNRLNNRPPYPLHASITTSLSTGGLAPYFPERYGSYLLPQAYPEGCPTHPAYGAGHATISGACATLLKAFFDESALIENPLVATADGMALVSYTGSDVAQLTVGGELNKLAGNIALFRDAAGVHWRSDYTESLPLGEAVAIGLLQEMSLTFNEDNAFFQFTRFDGITVRISHGEVKPLVY